MKNTLQQKDTIENYLASDQFMDFKSEEVSTLARKLELQAASDEITAVKTAYEYVRDNYPHTFDVNAEGVACSASDVIKLGHGICHAKAHLLAALLRYAGIPAGICYQRLCLDAPPGSRHCKPAYNSLPLPPPPSTAASGKQKLSGLSPVPQEQSGTAASSFPVLSGSTGPEHPATYASEPAAAYSCEPPCPCGAGPCSTRLVLHAVNAVFLKSLDKWIRMDARGNINDINAQFSLEHEQLAFTVHPQYAEEDGLVIYSKTPARVAHALTSSETARQLAENLPSYIPDSESILFTSNRPEIVMERGKGMYMWDTEGNKYLDFVGGWAVNCLGHSPEVITEALIKQAKVLVNCSPSFYNTRMLEFARLLTQNSCFDKVFFTSSGAEANESVIKLARKYGAKFKSGAYEIITTINGFHGRTLATMSATGKKQWESLFAPRVQGFAHVPFNDAEAVKKAITEKTCAIMLEPVQGEGGVNVADRAYIKELRKTCDDNGLLLIFDEIQTGIGRTGKLFAYEHYGIEPDVMTLAKGIGGGFPLSAMLTKKQFDIFEPGDQGGTYSGQPLAMSVGLAAIRSVINMDLPGHAEKMGSYIMARLNEIKEKYHISNIRGKGLLIAFDLASQNAGEVVAKCLAAGLVVNAPRPSTIRLMPPLIVTENEIDEMLDIFIRIMETITYVA